MEEISKFIRFNREFNENMSYDLLIELITLEDIIPNGIENELYDATVVFRKERSNFTDYKFDEELEKKELELICKIQFEEDSSLQVEEELNQISEFILKYPKYKILISHIEHCIYKDNKFITVYNEPFENQLKKYYEKKIMTIYIKYLMELEELEHNFNRIKEERILKNIYGLSEGTLNNEKTFKFIGFDDEYIDNMPSNLLSDFLYNLNQSQLPKKIKERLMMVETNRDNYLAFRFNEDMMMALVKLLKSKTPSYNTELELKYYEDCEKDLKEISDFILKFPKYARLIKSIEHCIYDREIDEFIPVYNEDLERYLEKYIEEKKLKIHEKYLIKLEKLKHNLEIIEGKIDK